MTDAVLMTANLSNDLAPAVLSAGYAWAVFDPARHLPSLHALLRGAYQNGGGSVPDWETWRASLLDDAEYDPSLVFLVVDNQRNLVAAALCWSSAYIKDLAVAADHHRHGLGRALLLKAFREFADRGAPTVALKVERTNKGAVRLYQSVGMTASIGP